MKNAWLLFNNRSKFEVQFSLTLSNKTTITKLLKMSPAVTERMRLRAKILCFQYMSQNLFLVQFMAILYILDKLNQTKVLGPFWASLKFTGYINNVDFGYPRLCTNILNKNQPFRFSRYYDGLKGKCRNTPFFSKIFRN